MFSEDEPWVAVFPVPVLNSCEICIAEIIFDRHDNRIFYKTEKEPDAGGDIVKCACVCGICKEKRRDEDDGKHEHSHVFCLEFHGEIVSQKLTNATWPCRVSNEFVP